MKLEEMPTELLLIKYDHMDTGPVEKMDIGAELRRRGAFPKKDIWTPPKWTPKYAAWR
jgi:hypothetical protein